MDIRVVTTGGHGVVHTQRETKPDDLGLGHVQQGSMNSDPAPFDTFAGRQVGHRLECLKVLGSTIGIAAVVQGIHANENIAGLQDLRAGQGIRQKNSVARRNIGHGDGRIRMGQVPPFGHADITGQGRTANRA